ncbi:MAG: hypothetical protein LBS42_05020 [Tannerella sp.]|jgi:hypothetical protein|nr:hypothetical protein [Tannerella sp.]
MQKIFLEPAVKKQLAREFKCSIQFVYRALGGDKETPLALRVRERAMALGGLKQRRKLVINGLAEGEAPFAGVENGIAG